MKTPITVCWLEGLFVCHWAYTKNCFMNPSSIRGGKMGPGSREHVEMLVWMKKPKKPGRFSAWLIVR